MIFLYSMLHKNKKIHFINKTSSMNQDKCTEQNHVKFQSCIFMTTRALEIFIWKYLTVF